jgi:F0F1-type ATP synthase assembly protein I
MAFQMLVYFGLGIFIGMKVDEWLNTNQPYFTILGLLLFASAYFYRLIRDLEKNK